MNLPAVHLINLDRSEGRLRRFREQNKHLGDVTRVSAVDGAAIIRSELGAGYVGVGFDGGAGSLGCALSHIGLWEKAVHEDCPLTILEDDAVAAHHFPAAAARVMSDLPADWDIIKWGLSANLTAWLDLGVAQVRLEGPWRLIRRDAASLRSFQLNAMPAAPIRMIYSLGLFGYSISPKGARTALDHCLPLRRRVIEVPDGGAPLEAKGLDAALCGALAGMQAFACLPTLVVHADEGESDRMSLDAARATDSA